MPQNIEDADTSISTGVDNSFISLEDVLGCLAIAAYRVVLRDNALLGFLQQPFTSAQVPAEKCYRKYPPFRTILF